MRRYSRGGQRRTTGTVVQSFKKVILHLPVSTAVQTAPDISVGTDSVAAGQTSITDANVPTGSIIKAVRVQVALSNNTANNVVVNMTIQQLHTGQGNVSPLAVGGNPQRNQVFKQWLIPIATGQEKMVDYLFKIPKKYQRVREGSRWRMVTESNFARFESYQFIYKFYR